VAAAEPAPLFPFVLPWDDASPGITDLSGWLPKPAGKSGPVRVGPGGHLYTGDRRLRLTASIWPSAPPFPPMITHVSAPLNRGFSRRGESQGRIRQSLAHLPSGGPPIRPTRRLPIC